MCLRAEQECCVMEDQDQNQDQDQLNVDNDDCGEDERADCPDQLRAK